MKKTKQGKLTASLDSVHELLNRTHLLKNETEKLIQEAKDLSAAGIQEAEKVVGFAKENWKTLMGMATAFGMLIKGKSKKTAKKKTAKKKTAKKIAKKIEKK